MIEFVIEVHVHPAQRGRLELIFGPGGAWGQAFAAAEGYRGTSVMRDADDPDRFMLVDVWDSTQAREHAIEGNTAAYEALQASLAEITTVVQQHGVFQLIQQAGVRPNPRGTRATRGRRRS